MQATTPNPAEQRRDIIRAIGQKAREITPAGSEVFLFGSHARGDAHDGSDWDVLILIDKDRITSDDIDKYTYPLREMGWDFNECINTVLFTKREWNMDSASPFHQNVKRDQIRL